MIFSNYDLKIIIFILERVLNILTDDKSSSYIRLNKIDVYVQNTEKCKQIKCL